ncbi:MAG: peptidylprolyl isomerase [Roseobacter sp.]
MQKHFRILATSFLVAAGGLPAAAQESETAIIEEVEIPTANTVIAKVNGTEITLGHMIAARATLDERYNTLPAQELYNGILEQLVQQEALAQRVPELRAMVALTLENEERSLKAGEAIEEALETAVSEEDIQSAYDAQYGSIDPQEEYNASHILVATEEEAIALKEAIDGGADFAATAREKSTGPSGPNGGELGWFGAGMMVPSFEAAAVALDIGEVSAPVETQFGWHVIKMNDSRKTEIPTLEAVRVELTNNLRNQAVGAIIQAAPDSAEIWIPELDYVTPDMLTQQEILDQ